MNVIGQLISAISGRMESAAEQATYDAVMRGAIRGGNRAAGDLGLTVVDDEPEELPTLLLTAEPAAPSRRRGAR